MSSRFQSSLQVLATSSQLQRAATPPDRISEHQRAWVDPASLPTHGDISTVAGNAPDYVKQLNNNTYMSYGVGAEECFGYKVGKSVKFVKVTVERNMQRQGRLSATTIAEVDVSKRVYDMTSVQMQAQRFGKDMLNGAGMLHGGCVAYLIDNCCSTPLVVLGIIHDANGVGVTQALNVLFHAPATLGTRLSITSTSITFGGRVMSSRCEIVDKDSGRAIASAFLNKMQPAPTRL